MVTPDEANRLSSINQQSANIPASVMVQATKTQSDDSFVEGLTDFFSKAKEKTYGAIKNAVFEQFNVNPDTGGFSELAVKGGLLGVRSLYENVIAEPIRTIGLVQQGATFSEAYKKENEDHRTKILRLNILIRFFISLPLRYTNKS